MRYRLMVAGLVAHCWAVAAQPEGFRLHMAALEGGADVRIGVAVVDPQGRLRLGHREQERFALCSTFKLPLAALVLQRIDQQLERPDRPLHYGAAQLLDHAPVARRYVASGHMSVEEANLASLQWSDNTAANLLLDTVGGPAGLTRFLRRLGDARSRLDRSEPDLNTNLPNDPRDTTTPMAITRTTQQLLWGTVLRPASRQQLQRWLMSNTTGDATIRAGVPAGWIVGEKTGSCEHGGRNDLGFVRPPNGPAYTLGVYVQAPGLSADQRNALIADVTRAVVTHLSAPPPLAP